MDIIGDMQRDREGISAIVTEFYKYMYKDNLNSDEKPRFLYVSELQEEN